MCVGARLCACIGCFDRGMGTMDFFPVLFNREEEGGGRDGGRLSSRPFDVFGDAAPIAFHRRKEKGKESSPSRRASDKTKHPGGCLRAAPVIRNVGGRIWYNGRASSCAREPKKRGRRDARSGEQDASDAPRRIPRGFAPDAILCNRCLWAFPRIQNLLYKLCELLINLLYKLIN